MILRTYVMTMELDPTDVCYCPHLIYKSHPLRKIPNITIEAMHEHLLIIDKLQIEAIICIFGASSFQILLKSTTVVTIWSLLNS